MNIPRLTLIAAVAAALGSTTLPAVAADTTRAAADTARTSTVAKDDARFFDQLVRGNLAEIQAGELARTKAVADPVKQYGARMVEDHKPMLEELRALGKKKGLTVPTAPDDKHMAAMKRLQQQSGKTFDRSYMTTMVQDHRATLDLLEEIVDKGKDPDLQAAARKAMPKVQAHLDAAKELAGKTELPERVYQNPPKGS